MVPVPVRPADVVAGETGELSVFLALETIFIKP